MAGGGGDVRPRTARDGPTKVTPARLLGGPPSRCRRPYRRPGAKESNRGSNAQVDEGSCVRPRATTRPIRDLGRRRECRLNRIPRNGRNVARTWTSHPKNTG